MVDFGFLGDAVGNLVFLRTADFQARSFPTELVVILPSLSVDGIISDPLVGGTIVDDTFPNRAQVIFPPGVLTALDTEVAIDVFSDPLDIPTPEGFSAPGTNFVNINLNPEPAFPLPFPGLTVILPLLDFTPPGTPLNLYRVDSATGNLVPALDFAGMPVVGIVNLDGSSATFTEITRLSVVVGLLLLPDVIPVTIDIKPGSFPNSINPRSKGVIPVAILTTPSFDATTVDPASTSFGPNGAAAVHGQRVRHLEDVDGDSDLDLVLHFRTQETGIQCGDASVTLTGNTISGQAIEGSESISTKGCK